MTSLKRFAAYAAVGATGTAVQYCVLLLGTTTGWVMPATASAVGAALGAVVNYWLNYFVTFRGTHRHASSVPKFVVTALAGVALTWVVMQVMIQRMHAPVLIAQLIATVLSLVMTFIINSVWTFRRSSEAGAV